MLNGALARRYSRALFDLAAEVSALEKMDSELRNIAEVIENNHELKFLLNHPNVNFETKKSVLAKIFDQSVSEITRHFLYLLIDRRRQNLIGLIQQEFSRLANEARNIIEAKVSSAAALSATQQEKLKKTIFDLTGKNVQMLIEVDPGLIGGVKLQIGDRVLDGSVATALKKMREELMKASYQPQQEIGVS